MVYIHIRFSELMLANRYYSLCKQIHYFLHFLGRQRRIPEPPRLLVKTFNHRHRTSSARLQ